MNTVDFVSLAAIFLLLGGAVGFLIGKASGRADDVEEKARLEKAAEDYEEWSDEFSFVVRRLKEAEKERKEVESLGAAIRALEAAEEKRREAEETNARIAAEIIRNHPLTERSVGVPAARTVVDYGKPGGDGCTGGGSQAGS